MAYGDNTTGEFWGGASGFGLGKAVIFLGHSNNGLPSLC